jgi:hypothetical protein
MDVPSTAEQEIEAVLQQRIARFEQDLAQQEETKRAFEGAVLGVANGDFGGFLAFEENAQAERERTLEIVQDAFNTGWLNGILLYRGQRYTGPFRGGDYVDGLLIVDGAPFSGARGSELFQDGRLS